jgi:hypothetical protein
MGSFTLRESTLRELVLSFEEERGNRIPMRLSIHLGWEGWKQDGAHYYMHPNGTHFIRHAVRADIPKERHNKWELWRLGGGIICSAPCLRKLYVEYMTLRLEGKE